MQLLDTSLRQLSAALAAQGKTPPTVFAAHLGGEHLDLWVAPANPEPPGPGSRSTAARCGGCRSRPRLSTGRRGRRARALPGPGEPGDERHRPDHGGPGGGARADRGARAAETVQSALAALAVELVTNRWSDRMRVTLVGFGEGLELIAPDRVTRGPYPGGGAARTGTAQRGTGGPDVRVGHGFRAHRALDDAQRGRLGAALPDHGGAADAAAGRSGCWPSAGPGTGPLSASSWPATCPARPGPGNSRPRGGCSAGVLGFDLAAQLLPAAQYAAVVSLFRDSEGDAPLTPPTAAECRPRTCSRERR